MITGSRASQRDRHTSPRSPAAACRRTLRCRYRYAHDQPSIHASPRAFDNPRTVVAPQVVSRQHLQKFGHTAAETKVPERSVERIARSLRLVTAVESGVAVRDLTAALHRRVAELDELRAGLSELSDEASCRPHISASWSKNSAVLNEATGPERAQVYASLDYTLITTRTRGK